MAEEALSIFLYDMEREGEPLSIPTKPGDIETYMHGNLLTPVSYSPDYARHEMLLRPVKLNVTIPEWMKLRAETMDINYSRILQGALMDLFDSCS